MSIIRVNKGILKSNLTGMQAAVMMFIAGNPVSLDDLLNQFNYSVIMDVMIEDNGLIERKIVYHDRTG